MLVERFLVGPIFIKEEMCLIVARLVHVVVDAAGLSTSGREKLQQLLLDLHFLARLGLDPSNNGNLSFCILTSQGSRQNSLTDRAILFRTPTQVNAMSLLRQVHAAPPSAGPAYRRQAAEEDWKRGSE